MVGLVVGADPFTKQLSTYYAQRNIPDLEGTRDTAPSLGSLIAWVMGNQTAATPHVKELQ